MEQSDMNELTMPARISALMDDEPEASGLAPSSAAFDAALHELSNNASAREIWLQYHQIGDLLRSSELTPLPGESQFLQRFSERLGLEAVQLAPVAIQAEQAAKAPRSRWSVASLATASVAAIALVSFSTLPSRHALDNTASFSAQLPQGVLTSPAVPQRVAQNLMSPVASAQMPAAASAGGQAVGAWSQYLMAHQQLAGSVLPYTPADIHEADLRVAASR